MRPALLLICTALLCCGTALAEWPHNNPKLTAKKVTIRRVVLLPAHVSFIRVGTRGSEGGLPEADQIAGSFDSAVSHELSARGVEVLAHGAASDEEKYAIADLQARYDSVAVQVRRKPGKVEKGAYTLGDRVAAFQPAASADAIVVLRGFGQTYTTGRKVMAAATWNVFGIKGVFRGELALIDSRTGEVLSFVRFQRQQNMAEKAEERIAEAVRLALHDVPLPLPPPKK